MNPFLDPIFTILPDFQVPGILSGLPFDGFAGMWSTAVS
jgi:uncharacterized membrane protein